MISNCFTVTPYWSDFFLIAQVIGRLYPIITAHHAFANERSESVIHHTSSWITLSSTLSSSFTLDNDCLIASRPQELSAFKISFN